MSVDSVTGCWNWTRATSNGRPFFRRNGKALLVYRALWEWLEGTPLKRSDFICHHCDNGLCCNPAHLFLGDQTANMRDMAQKHRNFSAVHPEAHAAAVRKGVQTRRDHPERNACGMRNGRKTRPESTPRGENHWMKTNPSLIRHGSEVHNALFSMAQVEEIRRDTRTLKTIALDYGCHFSTIGLIRSGKHYKFQ